MGPLSNRADGIPTKHGTGSGRTMLKKYFTDRNFDKCGTGVVFLPKTMRCECSGRFHEVGGVSQGMRASVEAYGKLGRVLLRVSGVLRMSAIGCESRAVL
jgi:hypothetical protein